MTLSWCSALRTNEISFSEGDCRRTCSEQFKFVVSCISYDYRLSTPGGIALTANRTALVFERFWWNILGLHRHAIKK